MISPCGIPPCLLLGDPMCTTSLNCTDTFYLLIPPCFIYLYSRRGRRRRPLGGPHKGYTLRVRAPESLCPPQTTFYRMWIQVGRNKYLNTRFVFIDPPWTPPQLRVLPPPQPRGPAEPPTAYLLLRVVEHHFLGEAGRQEY